MVIRSVKEAVRHLLFSVGAARKPSYLQPGNRSDRFSEIYRDGVWRHGDPEVPGSGHGSTLAATTGLRAELPRLLDTLGARVLLDIGCGDFTWMRETQLSQRYIGIDLVPAVIEANQRLYGNDKRSFALCDAVESELPDADVVMCREVIFHLSFADTRALIRNILAKPRSHILFTTDEATRFNSDIESGDYRILNLRRAPFRFPDPARAIAEDLVIPGRKLAVWTPADLAAFAA